MTIESVGNVVGRDGKNGAKGPVRRGRRGWPEWASYAASVWSLLYGALGLYWAFGGAGFPYGESEQAVNAGAILVGLPARTSGVVIAALGLLGALFCLAKVGMRFVPRSLWLVLGWCVSAFLILVVADGRVLMSMAYALMLNTERFTWEVVNQLICIAGGVLWAAMILAYQRSTSGRCLHGGGSPGHGARGQARLHGGRAHVSMAARVVTYIAAAAPLVYVIPRLLWAAGVPFGVTDEFFATLKLDQPAAQVLELTLGGMAIGGGVLTIGLVRPWGEVFPRWVPFLAGRRVAPIAVLIPAGLVGIALTVGGLSITRGILSMALGTTPATPDFIIGNWGAWVGNSAFLLWGGALLIAAVSYYRRRRRACGHCL